MVIPLVLAARICGCSGRIVLHAMRSHNHDHLAQEYGCTALRQLAYSADATVNEPTLGEGSGVRPTNCWSRSPNSNSRKGADEPGGNDDEQCTYAIGSKDIIAHIQLDRSFDQAE